MIIQSTDDIKIHVPVNFDIDFANVEPFTKSAEKKFILPLLGAALIEKISAEVVPDDLAELEELAGKPIAYLGLLMGYDLLAIKFSDSGIHRRETKDEFTSYQRQDAAAKKALENIGWEAIDNLLTYLEKNKVKYPDWEPITIQSDAWIRSTEEFNSIYPIRSSRLVFMQSMPFQLIAEELDILPIIGQELALLLKKGQTTDREVEMFRRVKRAVCFCTIKHGGYPLLLSAHGKNVATSGNAQNSESFNTGDWTEAILTQTMDNIKDLASSSLALVQTYKTLEFPELTIRQPFKWQLSTEDANLYAM